MRREQYIAKKATRVMEDKVEQVERKKAVIAEITDIAKEWKQACQKEKSKNKKEALSEYSDDVRSLHTKKCQLQKSVDTLQQRFGMGTHQHGRT